MTAYLAPLALTVLIETPVYVGILAGIMRIPVRHALCAALVVNLVSNPLLNTLLLPSLAHVLPSPAALLIAESIVCTLEALLLLAWLRRSPSVIVAASLIANACSFIAGILLL